MSLSVPFIFLQHGKRRFGFVFTSLFCSGIHRGRKTSSLHYKASLPPIFSAGSAYLLCNFLTVKIFSLASMRLFIFINLVPLLCQRQDSFTVVCTAKFLSIGAEETTYFQTSRLLRCWGNSQNVQQRSLVTIPPIVSVGLSRL